MHPESLRRGETGVEFVEILTSHRVIMKLEPLFLVMVDIMKHFTRGEWLSSVLDGVLFFPHISEFHDICILWIIYLRDSLILFYGFD